MKHLFLISSIVCRLILLSALFGAWGCSQPVQHELALQVEDDQSAQLTFDPVVQVKEEVPDSQPWPIVDLPEAQHTLNLDLDRPISSTLTSASEVDEWLKRVQLNVRVFLSKDGALLGDFMVVNKNSVPISEVQIACMEYDPNQVLLKTTNRIISAYEWIGADQEQFFGDVEFDYVDDAFETVTCQLVSLKAADSTASLH